MYHWGIQQTQQHKKSHWVRSWLLLFVLGEYMYKELSLISHKYSYWMQKQHALNASVIKLKKLVIILISNINISSCKSKSWFMTLCTLQSFHHNDEINMSCICPTQNHALNLTMNHSERENNLCASYWFV